MCVCIHYVHVNIQLLHFICIDHVNILQNKSGDDVVNNSIVNAFNNPERSVVLDCVTVRGHENAVWEVQYSPDTFDGIEIKTHSIYLSTIKLVDDGATNLISLKCVSDTSKEYRIVNVTTGRSVYTYVQ